MNSARLLTGYYADASFVFHSFLRYTDGTVVTFDAPNSTSTQATGIDSLGQIVGSFSDTTGRTHGFLRHIDGSFSTFDLSSAASTFPQAMNATGQITGMFSTGTCCGQGFMLQPGGPSAKFNVTGSLGTFPEAISPTGQITGEYQDSSALNHGFLRDGNGAIVPFDPVGSGDTFASSINTTGQIAGSFSDSNVVTHGYLRQPDGTFTEFDVAGSGGTYATVINALGQITGHSFDVTRIYAHGFLREVAGSIDEFDPPNSIYTIPTAISETGQVAGWFVDANAKYHGFLRTPGLPFLSFPLKQRTPFTAKIVSVFDHSSDGQYCADGVVKAYDGEQGSIGADKYPTHSVCWRTHTSNVLYAFSQEQSKPFSINGQYVGLGGDGGMTFLQYDGHPGLDVVTKDQSPDGKIPVLAAADGTVVCSHVPTNCTDTSTEDPCIEGPGEIKIRHANGYFSIYLHLSATLVSANQAVSSGQQIGVSGGTGTPQCASPHLHFEIRKGGAACTPGAQCTCNRSDTGNGNSCIPVDPYGWSGTGTDPYKHGSKTVENINLWK